MPLHPGRNVGILVFDGAEVLDFAGPFEVFNVAGENNVVDGVPSFHTFLLGVTGDPIVASGGMRVAPNASLADTPALDIAIVSGGLGSERLLRDDRVLRWLKAGAASEIVASVCSGALVLAQAGLLTDRQATTHHTDLDRLTLIDPSITVVRDQRYVRDASGGKAVVTSGGINAGIDMSLGIVRDLIGDGVDTVVEEMEWGWFGSCR
jgi:transcriptional regulator GlxA family with amidase domain